MYADNFESKSASKTILLDETMTIDNLVATCMKRFSLEGVDSRNYFIFLLLVEDRIIPAREDLVSNAFSKYSSFLDKGTGRVYLSRGESAQKSSRYNSKSDASASIASQKRISNSVGLIASSEKTKRNSEMSCQQFMSYLDSIYNTEYITKIYLNIENIELNQSQFSNRVESLQNSARHWTREERDVDQDYATIISQTNENMELVKALQKNLEAVLLISVKLWAA